MAKSEKKISIASLDKVLKEQAVDIATEQWFGNEVKIKHTLSFSEALAFVDDVVSSCFHTTGGYMPELQEFVVKSNILTRYANFNLPDNLEHRYSLLYNTDAVDVVIRHINQKQLDDILESISEKISYLCESNIAAIERQMNEVVSAFTELQKKTEAMFANITPDDMTTRWMFLQIWLHLHMNFRLTLQTSYLPKNSHRFETAWSWVRACISTSAVSRQSRHISSSLS